MIRLESYTKYTENRIFNWSATFVSEETRDPALDQLWLHLKQLEQESLCGYVELHFSLGRLYARFEDLDQIMLVKLQFCGGE